MRIYVEAKENFNIEANEMLSEIKNYLEIDGISNLKISHGYDVQGISSEQLEGSIYSIFANKGTHNVSSNLNLGDCTFSFSYRFLESQYDQKSDSVATLLKLLYPSTTPVVNTITTIMVFGEISKVEFDKIKKYYINPLEAREVEIGDDLETKFSTEIEPVIIIEGFINANKPELEKIKAEYGVSMSMEDFAFCQDYYIKENRNPTITELKILDTYWSDHCRHSTFLTVLEDIQIENNIYTKGLNDAIERFEATKSMLYPNGRPTCLMDIATSEMKNLRKQGKLSDLEQSEEINACSIEVKGEVDGKPEDFIIMFKNETHNHPTEMEPFGGAATCIGGGIRDPLSGRSYVYGAMRITGSADPREAYEDTLADKLPQRKITTTAADGYSSYGNQIGLASGYLQEFYDPGFKAKRMECGALVAYNYKKNITRENGVAGDIIILLGGKTGRDGIGGATGSSKQQAEAAIKYSSEVQKGNALIERNIVRLFKKSEISKLIKKCNDFGAGGVSVAIGELSDSLYIDLDKVPVKYSGLNGTEIAISESQERMAVLIAEKDADNFIKAAEAENLMATKVAKVTKDKRIVMNFKGEVICNLASDFLNSGGVRQKADVIVKAPEFTLENPLKSDVKSQWIETIADINISSKKGIANQFDKTTGGQTTFFPFGGTYMKTPEQGLAMKLPLEQGSTDLGTIMTVGYNPKLGYQSPFHGAMYAVLESIMKVVSMGGELSKTRLSFQEYFESMKSKESWGKVYSALMGAYLVQNQLSVPAIGGKDSMSGSYKDIDVPPSLISFAVSPCDCKNLVSKAFKSVGSNVYLIKTEILRDGTPNFEQLKENISGLEELIKKGKVKAAAIVGTGGVAATVSQMCFGNNIGFEFADKLSSLFEDNYTDIIIETSEILDYHIIGKTTSEPEIKYSEIIITLEEALSAWENSLENVFKTKFDFENTKIPKLEKINKIEPKTPNQKKTPKVLIPIFYGTNGEYTLKRQFQKAGAEVVEYLFKTADPMRSYKKLAEKIALADVIAIPSGMSAGAEPEAAKMISIILKEEKVKTAINALIDRGGLIMGFGEGFKALIETGMIENGKIEEQKDTLTVTRNKSGKFYSALIATDMINSVYPWSDDNSTIVPVGVIDGCICLNQADFEKYHTKGQILSVYSESNQIDSSYGIESMVSENGQIFGSMGDISQLEEGLCTNVFNSKTHACFKHIVEFFSK